MTIALFLYYDTIAVNFGIIISFIFPPFSQKSVGVGMKTMLSHEEIVETVVLNNSKNPGSAVCQGPRFPVGWG